MLIYCTGMIATAAYLLTQQGPIEMQLRMQNEFEKSFLGEDSDIPPWLVLGVMAAIWPIVVGSIVLDMINRS